MRRPLAVFCLVCLLAVGGLVCFKPPEYPDISEMEGKECQVIGRVDKIEYKMIFGKEQSVLYLKQISYFAEIQAKSHTQHADRMPTGLVCYISKEEPIPLKIGSTVLVSGIFEGFPEATNPGEFDTRLYYRILGLSGKIKKASVLKTGTEYDKIADLQFSLRCFLEGKIKACYPEKEAGIMMTMLLGNKTELDEEIKDLYRGAGILHILSVSGLHVSVLGYGFHRLLRKAGLPVRFCAVLAVCWMWFYGGMIGMGVSAFRAVLMFGIRMLAKWCGRTYDLLTALAVAAVLLISSEPLYFFHSGFWLSFTCVLAISLLYPRLKVKEKEGGGIKVRVVNSILLGISVTVMTLPVFLWFYYEVSFWGILWNLVVVPLMSVVMGGGIVNLALPGFASGLSSLVAKGNCVVLWLFETLCRVTEQTGCGNLILGQPAVFQILAFVIGMLLFLWLSQKWRLYQKMLVLSVLTMLVVFRLPGGFRITFLDVGQGDGICLQNENGNVYLIDGGSSSKSKVGTYQILPFLKQQGIRRVQAVFVSHSDSDHISGILELLEQQRGGVKLEKIVLSKVKGQVLWEEYGELLTLCRENGTAVYTIKKGEQLRDDKLTLTCLHPAPDFMGDSNASSQVLRVDYKNFSALLTGDVEGEGALCLQQVLIEQEIAPVTVLKAAHHGSRNSTSQTFLAQTQPMLTVISCGKNNRYGHPHEEVIRRLTDVKSTILQTARQGAVTVQVQGERIKVSTWCGSF